MAAGAGVFSADGPRVWIVGRSALARAGLRALLLECDVLVAGATPELLPEPLDADVLIVLDGWSAEEALRHSSLPLLLISEGWFEVAADGRPWAWLPGDATPDELIVTLQALRLGLAVAPAAALARSLRPSQAAEPLAEPLTARESTVLQLLAEGLTNRQLAARLQLSEHTVKFHLSSIFGKLGVASRTEAIRAGTQQGLIVW